MAAPTFDTDAITTAISDAFAQIDTSEVDANIQAIEAQVVAITEAVAEFVTKAIEEAI
ncbi:hypothetical protein [Pseudoalteromonas phage J2-1_QLiu-2017]|nr:hypothetical protein [Pseudoalteromonas phage J2-1_QLiu-2017]